MAYVNINRVIDVQSVVAAAPAGRRNFQAVLFIFKGALIGGNRVNKATSLQEAIDLAGSNTEVVKAATTYFNGGFNGIKPSEFYFANYDSEGVDNSKWTDVITELLSNPSYYWITCDNNIIADEQKSLMSAVEASTVIPFYLLIQDTVVDAISKDKGTDTESLSAYAFKQKFTKTAVFYADDAKKDSYYQLAAASYFGTVDFTAARPLGSLAHKQFAGIESIAFTGATTPTAGYDNLISKNANCYVNFGEVGRALMEKGNAADGNDISVRFAADYLNYTITYNIFDLLTQLPALRFTVQGKGLLYNAISRAFKDLVAAGVLGAGTDAVTGEEYISGYKIDIPLDTITASDKQQGIWKNITCTGLLTGFAKVIRITNTLKF